MDFEALSEFEAALKQANGAAQRVLDSISELNSQYLNEAARYGGSPEKGVLVDVRRLLGDEALHSLKTLGVAVPRPTVMQVEGRSVNQTPPLRELVEARLRSAEKRLERWKRGGGWT